MEQELLYLLLDRPKQEKATLGNIAYAFTQIHQARRLESDQSTANLALHSIVEAVERDRTKTEAPPDVVFEASTTSSEGAHNQAGDVQVFDNSEVDGSRSDKQDSVA